MAVTLHHGDALDVLATLPAQSVDAVICDPPYGTTACKWDSVIPFAPMWAQLKRLIKPRGAIVLFGSQPFTSALVMSNPEMFKYQWVWKKTRSTDFVNSKNKPLKAHEDICVFSDGTTANKSGRRMIYNPQGLIYNPSHQYRPSPKMRNGGVIGERPSHVRGYDREWENYPGSVLEFANPNNDTLHPTQKPVALMEYLVKTYTNAGDVVLDFTCGSGSTGVACVQTGRSFIGVERDAGYFAIAQRRIDEAMPLAALETMPLLTERHARPMQMSLLEGV